MINGNSIRLAIDGNEIGNAQVAGLDFVNSVVEITSIDTNGWREIITGQKSFSVSFDGLGLEDLWRYEGREISFLFSIGTYSLFGRGLLTNVSYSGGVDNAAGYSGVIESSGELLRMIPTVVRTICFMGQPLCFNGETIQGPEIDFNN